MDQYEVETPHGIARVALRAAEQPRAALVLGHGAGGGITAADLQVAADVALAANVSVALVEQPYRVAGRRAPAPAAQLDAAWLAVIGHLINDQIGPRGGDAADRPGGDAADRPGGDAADRPGGDAADRPGGDAADRPGGDAADRAGRAGGRGALSRTQLIVGGRSLGARVACRKARETGAIAVLCLAFPLHPPGRSAAAAAKTRLPELDQVSVPTLVVQGERDPFGIPPEGPNRNVVLVPGDHSLRKDRAAVAAAVSGWLEVVLPRR